MRDIKNILIEARDRAREVYCEENKKAQIVWKSRAKHPGFGHAFICVFMDGRSRLAKDILKYSEEIEGLSIKRDETGMYHLSIDECFSVASIAERGCEVATEILERELGVKAFMQRFDD